MNDTIPSAVQDHAADASGVAEPAALRLPDFLIIGAAKAGTTTLYKDLDTHPRIYFPFHKEPACLAHDPILTPEGLADYARLFEEAGDDQLAGEASTAYTKMLRNTNAPAYARRVLGDRVRLIYIMREPVSRAISMHGHLYNDGLLPRAFDDALKLEDERLGDLINIGLYGEQLGPWIEQFGRDAIHLIVFEEYIRDRVETISKVCEHLGLEPRPDLIEVDKKYNVTDARRYGRGAIGGMVKSLTNRPAWKLGVRKYVPNWLVNTGKRVLFRPPADKPIPPSSAVIDRMIERFEADSKRVAELLGRETGPWDFAAVREKYVKRSG